MIYTVKLKRKPKELDTLNTINSFKFSKRPTILCPAFDVNLGKHLTGLDEDDLELLNLPKDEAKAERERRMSKRAELEEKLGISSLKATNFDYWHEFAVELVEGMVFDTTYPKHELQIIVLKRRGDVAFGRSDIWNPKCKDIEFYLDTEEQVKKEGSSDRKKKLRGFSELAKLSENNERLFNVAYFLNLSPKKDETVDELQDKLQTFMEVDNENLEKFIDTCIMDGEKLQTIIMLKKADKAKVILFDKESRVWKRGAKNFRNTLEASADYLLLPANSGDWNEIAEEVAKKEKGKLIYA